jgi:hypothetical protein
MTGGPPVAVTSDPAWDWGPDWSPDGTRIAFTSDRSGSVDIWLVGPDGTGLTQITDDGATDQGPLWAADGSRLVFVSDRSGEWEIWSVAPDGTDPRNLSRSERTLDGEWDAGDATADGRIVFARSAYGPVENQPLVREDLALFGLLLTAAVLAVVAALVGSIRPPVGAFTVIFVVWTALLATHWDAWRFVPAAAIAGIAVDALVRAQRPARRALTAAAAAPAAYATAMLVASAATAGLGWSLTLAAGAVLTCLVIGWALGLVARPATAAQGA